MGSPCGFVLTSASLMMHLLAISPVIPALALALHLLGRMAVRRGARQAAGRRHEGEGIGVSLAAVDFRRGPGEPHVFAVVRQLDAHLLAYALEDRRYPFQFRRIGITDCKHGVFMALFGTDRHRAAVRS